MTPWKPLALAAVMAILPPAAARAQIFVSTGSRSGLRLYDRTGQGSDFWLDPAGGILDIRANRAVVSSMTATGQLNVASMTVTGVTPSTPTAANTLYSKNIVSGWIQFDGTTSPPTIKDSFNVSSVGKNSAGNYTVNWATSFANANYAVTVSGTDTDLGTLAAGSAVVRSFDPTGGLPLDYGVMCVIAIGAQ